MTKIYPIIQVDNFLYAVEYGVKLKGTDQFAFVEGTPKTWATTNPSLGLPLIPLESDPSRLCPYWGITGYEIWMEGYKAAKGEGRMYSEKDLVSFSKFEKNWMDENKVWKSVDGYKKYGTGENFTNEQVVNLFVKSLNPPITAIECAIEDVPGKFYQNEEYRHLHRAAGWAKPDNFLITRPRVENGFIIVKKFLYE